MTGRENERGLLFGLLALQNHFVDRDGLVAAFNAWLGDRSRPIDLVLMDRGLIAPDLQALVAQLVDRLISTSPDAPPTPGAPNDESTHAYFSALASSSVPGGEVTDGEDTDPEPTGSVVADSGSVDGRFGLVRFHAKGGLGEVYVARDAQLNREVALKVIQEPYADHWQSRERFLREAEITGRLEHPGVVPVYALGANSLGQPYYAMRFIRGRSLDAAIAEFHKGGPEGRAVGSARVLALRELLGRFLAACDAVSYAHSRGVVHRDLKPANIMLGPFGETLVVDWGLAKPVGRAEDPDPSGHADEGTLRPGSGDGSAETVPGAVQGTPGFMSPEQARGENDRLGPACDVYSLGATLYQILTGRPPFRGKKEEVLPKVMAGDFPPPRQVAREVPRELEAVCLKAMRLRPGERYPRVADLAEDVRHWLADEPVAALPESAAQKVGRWARRNRAQARAAVVALLAVAVVSTFAALATLTALRNETRALDHAGKSLDAERRAAGQARDSAALANRNLAVARRAVVGLLNGLAEGSLATLPQVGRLRAEISQSASAYIDELLASNPADPELRARRPWSTASGPTSPRPPRVRPGRGRVRPVDRAARRVRPGRGHRGGPEDPGLGPLRLGRGPAHGEPPCRCRGAVPREPRPAGRGPRRCIQGSELSPAAQGSGRAGRSRRASGRLGQSGRGRRGVPGGRRRARAAGRGREARSGRRSGDGPGPARPGRRVA
ncbi:MAG: serine/threonine-protein kinase [Isosphaeraceae bacterium]